jgi:hypothetical protein
VSERQQASLTSHEKFEEQLAANQDTSTALQEGKYSTLPLWQRPGYKTHITFMKP